MDAVAYKALTPADHAAGAAPCRLITCSIPQQLVTHDLSNITNHHQATRVGGPQQSDEHHLSEYLQHADIHLVGVQAGNMLADNNCTCLSANWCAVS